MGLHPCGFVAKVFLAIINVVYILVGFILIGVGISLLIEKEEFQVLTGDDNLILGILFIVAGCFTILVSSIGLVSSVLELTPFLVAYSVLMFTLIGVEVAGASVCYSERSGIVHRADTKFAEYMGKYRDPSSQDFNEKVNEVIDIAQKGLHCCGQSTYSDWAIYNTKYFLAYGYPPSCSCDPDTVGSSCIKMLSAGGGVWRKGCNETFYGAIGSNFTAIGGAGIGIAFIQLFAIFLGMSLCCCIMTAKSTERRIARIQAAAYTQLESFPTDTEDDTEDDYEDQEPTFRNILDPESTPTLHDEMEPNDSVPTNDRSMYIQ